MAFKLGKNKGPEMTRGVMSSKLNFSKERDVETIVPGVPIIRKNLEEGIAGEANMDGSIYLDKSLTPGSFKEREVLIHEMRHATDMKIGKLKYEDDYVKYNGETYPRKDIKGKDMICYNGKWIEAGDDDFPWELDANNGNK